MFLESLSTFYDRVPLPEIIRTSLLFYRVKSSTGYSGNNNFSYPLTHISHKLKWLHAQKNKIQLAIVGWLKDKADISTNNFIIDDMYSKV